MAIPACYKGETVMHGAALRGWVKLAELLKEAGADLDATDADGKTPLDYAMGRYRMGFLENPPAPKPKVAEALRATEVQELTHPTSLAAGCGPRQLGVGDGVGQSQTSRSGD